MRYVYAAGTDGSDRDQAFLMHGLHDSCKLACMEAHVSIQATSTSRFPGCRQKNRHSAVDDALCDRAGRPSLPGALHLLLLGLLLIGWTTNAAYAQPPGMVPRPKSITVVMDDNYPPFIFRNSEGEIQGILKDTWALWEARTGIAVNLQAMD